MLANIKTSALGVLQLLMVGAFVVSKFRTAAPFSDAEVTLISAVLVSGVKGLVGADAKQDPK